MSEAEREINRAKEADRMAKRRALNKLRGTSGWKVAVVSGQKAMEDRVIKEEEQVRFVCANHCTDLIIYMISQSSRGGICGQYRLKTQYSRVNARLQSLSLWCI